MCKLTEAEIAAAVPPGWSRQGDALVATFETGSFANGAEFVAAIAVAADDANHHPDITLTYPCIGILLTTHEAGGITRLDVDLAGRVGELAAERGFAPIQ